MANIDQETLSRNPHLSKYVKKFEEETGKTILFSPEGPRDRVKIPNIMYPVGDPIFIHLYRDKKFRLKYQIVEPELDDTGFDKMQDILELILRKAAHQSPYTNRQEFDELIDVLYKESIIIAGKEQMSFKDRLRGEKVEVTDAEEKTIVYFIKRDIMDSGPLQPILQDPYIEDVHSVGLRPIHLIHKVYGMVETSVKFRDDAQLDHFLKSMSERIGRPVSDTKPIVDGALPDGSRINIVYAEDVSREGSSFTIRKFAEKPPTIPQLVAWKSMSPEIAAYLWLCLENGMSIMVSGETASGKTTSLNAMLMFINFDRKLFTAEDTPEVIVPQGVWQRLITRESGPVETHVTLFDLLKSALRSRPDYIIVGEIRGAEGATAFQAMQTGHPVIATFHASSIQRMIQRFTGDPINVPAKFMDNLNVALFQSVLYFGGRIIRRVTGLEEILRFSSVHNGILTRGVFTYDPVTDTHAFRGRNNSYILESKIAGKLGMADTREIYKDLDRRAKIIERMVEAQIFAYDEVKEMFRSYSNAGFDGLPPELVDG